MRICPWRHLVSSAEALQAAARACLGHILAVPLGDEAWARADLPGEYGGCGLSLPSAQGAAA
eukprot:6799631-Prorocentrum_lima.AAC.1